MTNVRLDRAADGCCTLFIGRMLILSDLTEAQAAELTQVYGAGDEVAVPAPKLVGAIADRDVGGRTGRTLPRSPVRAFDQALARLR